MPKPFLYALCLLAVLLGFPVYMVWCKTYLGKAELARQGLLAQAEVARAEGVAKANEIIGKSLDGKDNYLKYLWVQSLNNGQHHLIYIPTESGMPIIEAGRAVKD